MQKKPKTPLSPAELKTLRAQLGLSQQALADQLGVTRNTVNRWEMGLYPIPRIAVCLLLHLAVAEKNKNFRDHGGPTALTNGSTDS